jgi:uncharacterized damage-inducible protein DinB
VIEANIALLEQCRELLGRLGDRLYTQAPQGVAKSATGGHVRHCLDFYACFLDGVATRRIDYDARTRSPRIERERRQAIARIETTIGRLRALPAASESLAVRVKMDGALAWADSCVARELLFLQSHTVHHFALIATLLRLGGFEPAPDFGIAPSTQQYLRASLVN